MFEWPIAATCWSIFFWINRWRLTTFSMISGLYSSWMNSGGTMFPKNLFAASVGEITVPIGRSRW